MNGLTLTEPEVSEFVEVDPTGRYGRVCLSPRTPPNSQLFSLH